MKISRKLRHLHTKTCHLALWWTSVQVNKATTETRKTIAERPTIETRKSTEASAATEIMAAMEISAAMEITKGTEERTAAETRKIVEIEATETTARKQQLISEILIVAIFWTFDSGLKNKRTGYFLMILNIWTLEYFFKI